MLPHFDELVRDKIGSNLVQTAFRVATLAHQDEIVAKMVPDVVELTCDPFANYLVRDVMRSRRTASEALITATLQNADRLFQHKSGPFQVRRAFFDDEPPTSQEECDWRPHSWMDAADCPYSRRLRERPPLERD